MDGAVNDDELSQLLPLTPAAFHILLALAAGERHGYGIMREIAATTAGAFRLGPGTLYRTIAQLVALNLVEEAEERPDPSLDDQRRRYYRLTAHGRRVAQLEAMRLARLVRAAEARQLLGESGVGQPGLGQLGWGGVTNGGSR